MSLQESLIYQHFVYQDEVLYKIIEDFHFVYVKLKNNKEVLAICLNKALLHKNDLKVMNEKFKGVANFYSDNVLLRNDVIYIELINYDNIINNLESIGKYLHYINYHERKNCIMCGCKSTYNVVDNKLIPIEEKCVCKYHNELDVLRQKNTNRKKAFLFSVLGSLVGILPSLIIALLVENYTIVSSILVFISPFLSVILYYKNDVNRTTNSDFVCLLTSSLFVLLYHFVLVFICINSQDITSISMYFDVLKFDIIESIIETIMMFVFGACSSFFLTKKKTLIRFSKV